MQQRSSAESAAHARDAGSLIVVGTGIQGGGQTTLAARCAVARAERVLFAVADPWTVRWIRDLHPQAESLPYPMDDSPRRQTYAEMVSRIVAEVRKGFRVCAVFYGHPGVLTAAAHEAIRQARSEGFHARMLPGISALDCLFADLGVDPGREGCQVYEATDFLIRGRGFDIQTPLVLCQVGLIGNPGFFDGSNAARIRCGLTVLGEVLRRRFPAMHQAVIYEAGVLPTEQPRLEPIALGALADAVVSELSTLYVPPLVPAAVDEEMLVRLGMDLPTEAALAGRSSTALHATHRR